MPEPFQTDRPDPDALIASIAKARETARRGKLKIFFGMCPGVGKTYAMLQAARQMQAQGVEVIIGIVETHGRAETQALIEGLPIVPRAAVDYRDTQLEEMDLDAILLWHPGLAVVDELAHSNAPGSRHPKRYQDVLELLDAGIDVFTTVNVQHIESRSDTVQQITGILVRETVPDSILDCADEVVLIDLSPQQLRERLAAGRVYLGGRAQAAAENFFKESNLTALREMSLRLVAEHVDRDLRDLMQENRIAGPWKSGDRLLVAVSGSPFSEKLIRYTRRLAATMEASWIAANIEGPHPLDTASQLQLNRYLALARELGAEVLSAPGHDVAETLLRLAQQHNISQIVLGKPLEGGWWHRLRGGSPVDWLIRHSGDIDIHMIRSEETPSRPRRSLAQILDATPFSSYGVAVLLAVLVTGVCLLVYQWTGYWAVALFYLLTVVLAATRLPRWPTLFLGALSAALWDFLFIPPRFTFYVRQLHDFMMLGAYFVVAIVIGHYTTRLRDRERAERRREERSTALYQLTRELAASRDLAGALQTVVALLKKTFHADALVWLRDAHGLVPHPLGSPPFSDKDESVAAWACQKKQAAGRFTDTLPDSGALYLPLLAGDRAEGALAIRLEQSPSDEQRGLLDAFASQLALFVNKERAVAENREAQLTARSQKLQNTLFDSVSHELKTPLAAMSAALQQPQPDLAELRQAVRRLSRTVDHLLDLTRLESGLLQPRREWCEPGELLQQAIKIAAIEGREIWTNLPPDLPPVLVDGGLIEQALIVLLTNAASYSPAHREIEAGIFREETALVFTIADRGPGLAPGEEVKVFEKFYRGSGSRTGGLGLGLAIARQLVEAHSGTLSAANRAEGGARFSIRLPLGEPMTLPPEPPFQ